MAVLEKLIENAVVPRLLLGSRTAFHPVVSDAPSSTPVTVENVGELAELVTKPDAAASIAYFEVLRAGGASVEMLFQDLLVPVARRLGELWDEDINDFMDVTRGASHLQQIVREYGDAFHSEARQPVSNRRMLLMTMPGEQHTLGISMVGEHFRRAGWHVWGGPPRTIDDILELVDAQWFDVIGLSLSRVPDPGRSRAISPASGKHPSTRTLSCKSGADPSARIRLLWLPSALMPLRWTVAKPCFRSPR
jgi:hypothetical protein